MKLTRRSIRHRCLQPQGHLFLEPWTLPRGLSCGNDPCYSLQNCAPFWPQQPSPPDPTSTNIPANIYLLYMYISACAKGFICLTRYAYGVMTILKPIFWMRKLRFKEIK